MENSYRRIDNYGRQDQSSKDLKRVSVKETEEDLPFINKFSGTGDRNEEPKEERDRLADALVSGDKIWGGDGTPIY